MVLGKYFFLMLYPSTLIFDYGYNHIPYVSFSDAKVLLSVVFHLLLAYISIRMCIKRQIAGFLLLTYLAGVLLMSNLFGFLVMLFQYELAAYSLYLLFELDRLPVFNWVARRRVG